MFGGKTPSEEYLSRLCHHSFLSLWSFPNVFNNNGLEKNGIGKELCDLLVVFGNDIIIFSDKSCQYKNTGRLSVDWNRWYRKSIEKSADQIYGAERWIRNSPTSLFLDDRCTKPFPIDMPSKDNLRIHRVAIALGAKEECVKFYGGGSGSLRISTDENPIMNNDKEDRKAFTVGFSEKEKGYVHIFDDVTLDIVMKELNTIDDFCAYLRKKEDLLEKTHLHAGGEEEVLAYYLQNMDEDGGHGFDFSKTSPDRVFMMEGIWDGLKNDMKYKIKKANDEISYLWDNLIEYLNKSVREGNTEKEVDARSYEKGVRLMASLCRVERRAVSRKLFQAIDNTPPDGTRYSAAIMGKNGEKAFAFFLMPPLDYCDYKKYREVRSKVLEAFCGIIKYKYKTVKEAVGISMEPPRGGRGQSEEMGYFDFTDWSEEDNLRAESDKEALGIRADQEFFTEREYPSQQALKANSKEARRRFRQMQKAMERQKNTSK